MHIIHIEPQAPPKPRQGQACNGCGICCLAEPCPLGVALFRRRTGACGALVWNSQTLQYRCGALADPQATAAKAVSPWLAWLRPVLVGVLKLGAARWVASATGCDSSLEPVPSDASEQPTKSEYRRNDST